MLGPGMAQGKADNLEVPPFDKSFWKEWTWKGDLRIPEHLVGGHCDQGFSVFVGGGERSRGSARERVGGGGEKQGKGTELWQSRDGLSLVGRSLATVLWIILFSDSHPTKVPGYLSHC